MGFYLRDALNIGPFRFNLSKSGIGVSVGVKGLRVGSGPRGPYVHAGRDGIYYRAALGGRGQRHGDCVRNSGPNDMVSLSMPSAAVMSHDGESDMVRALNRAHAIRSIGPKLAGGAVALSVLATQQYGTSALLGLAVAPLLWMLARRIDRHRRMVAWSYAEQAVVDARYAALVAAFDKLATAARCERIVAGRVVNEGHDAKRNAGATHLTDTRPAALARRGPTMLRCNLVPPAIDLASTSLYLMPDMLLIGDRTGYAGIPYDAITARWETGRYVENGPVPLDTEIVDSSWAYPNKDGGPDHRFADNRKLPVCLNGIVHLARTEMFDLVLKLSSVAHLADFVDAIRAMGSSAGSGDDPALLVGDGDGGSLFEKMVIAATQTARTTQANGIVHLARTEMFDLVLKLSSVAHLADFVDAIRAMGSSAGSGDDPALLVGDGDGGSLFEEDGDRRDTNRQDDAGDAARADGRRCGRTPLVTRHHRALFAVGAILAAASALMTSCTMPHGAGSAFAEAYHAVDGDTLRCGGERIRLLGIDAPELPGHCRHDRVCASGDPYASRDSLAAMMVPALGIVRIGHDRYGRTLAMVNRKGEDLSCWQLRHHQAVYKQRWDNGHRVAIRCPGAVLAAER